MPADKISWCEYIIISLMQICLSLGTYFSFWVAQYNRKNNKYTSCFVLRPCKLTSYKKFKLLGAWLVRSRARINIINVPAQLKANTFFSLILFINLQMPFSKRSIFTVAPKLNSEVYNNFQ